MIRHPHPPRLREGAPLVLLILVLTAAGCGSRPDVPDAPARAAIPTTSSMQSPTAPQAEAAPPRDAAQAPVGEVVRTDDAAPEPEPAGTATRQQPRRTTRPEATKPADDAAGRRPAPIEPGTYRYATDGTVQIGQGPPRDMPQTTTLTAARPQSNRQRQVRDLRDKDGVGTVTEQILQFDDEGVRLAFMKISSTFAGISSTYSFTPAEPPLVLKRGLRQGDRTQFVLHGDGVTIRTTVSVTGAERFDVDGTRLEAAVVVFDSVLSGRLSGKQRAENRIDTNRGITVKEEVASDVTSSSVRVRSSYRTELTSLTAE